MCELSVRHFSGHLLELVNFSGHLSGVSEYIHVCTYFSTVNENIKQKTYLYFYSIRICCSFVVLHQNLDHLM